MESVTFPYKMEDQLILNTSCDTKTTVTETLSAADVNSKFSPLATPFQSRGNDVLTLLTQQEPRSADTAPTSAELDAEFMNFRLSNAELFDDVESNNFFSGRTDNMPPNATWGEDVNARSGEMMDTFDFLVKSISSANNYVSMLTREQLSVLRAIRPSLLYEFLQEVAKVRSDKRVRRALPNECAFCKNNGENEECYASHALKDWRGRVLCPVLRAFRCPRCGATGDRAHTIKYCPENNDNSLDRGFSSRRRPSSLFMPQTSGMSSGPRTPQTAAPSSAPSPSSMPNSVWSNFGIN